MEVFSFDVNVILWREYQANNWIFEFGIRVEVCTWRNRDKNCFLKTEKFDVIDDDFLCDS